VNRLLRRIFGPKGEKLPGEWTKELHKLYSSPNMIRVNKSMTFDERVM
jgi:hypothetical protein